MITFFRTGAMVTTFLALAHIALGDLKMFLAWQSISLALAAHADLVQIRKAISLDD